MKFKIGDVVTSNAYSEQLYEITKLDDKTLHLTYWNSDETIDLWVKNFKYRLATDIEKACGKQFPTPVEIAQARIAGLI